MADFTPSIYPSGMTPYQPPNALQQVGQAVGIKNQLMQNQLLQQQAQIQQSQIRAHQILASHANADGTFDYNAAKSEAAQDPVAAPYINDFILEANKANERTQSSINSQGQPIYDSAQAVSSGFNPVGNNQRSAGGSNSSQQVIAPGSLRGSTMDAPFGQKDLTENLTKDNQSYINNTRAQAAISADAIPVLEKIRNLAKKVQTGPQADKIQNWKSGLSEIFGTNADDPATFEELRKYMLANGLSQAAANSANSNERTAHYIATNPNTQILPEAIEPLAAYQEALHKQNIGEANGMEKALAGVNQTNPSEINAAMTGTDPVKNPGYRGLFRNNKNTQFYEYMSLPDKDSKAQYLASHPDVATAIASGKLKKIKDIGATYQ